MRKMKKNVFLALFLSATLACVSCSSDDDTTNIPDNKGKVLTVSEYPQEIITYTGTYFPENEIRRIIYADKDGRNASYKTLLSGNVGIQFNAAKKPVQMSSITTALPLSVIPVKIQQYVKDNYPKNIIVEWEVDDNEQEVELDNEIELTFNLSGDFVKKETNTDNETEIRLNVADYPQEITSYVTSHFSHNVLLKIEKEVKGLLVSYDVVLAGDVELSFDEAKKVVEIESDTRLPDSVIPSRILEYVKNNYPTNVVVEWELKNIVQEVTLDNDVDLIFNLSGDFVRIAH